MQWARATASPATQLDLLNRINGAIYAAQAYGNRAINNENGLILPIFFSEPWRKDISQQDVMALPSARLNTLEIEVDFAALPTNGVAFKFSATAEVDSGDQPGADKSGLVIGKVFRQNLSGGTAAGYSVDLNTLDRRDLYQAIYANLGSDVAPGTAAAGITMTAATGLQNAKLQLKANSTVIAEVDKESAYGIHAQNGLNPGQFDLECVLDSGDAMQSGFVANGVQDLQLRIENGGGGCSSANWTILVERVGPID
jgi:hypothetical protein